MSKCGDCRFFKPNEALVIDQQGDLNGYCHRYPPLPTEERLHDEDGHLMAESLYDRSWPPVASETDWCGEFKPLAAQEHE